jgi:hypothetical protein
MNDKMKNIDENRFIFNSQTRLNNIPHGLYLKSSSENKKGYKDLIKRLNTISYYNRIVKIFLVLFILFLLIIAFCKFLGLSSSKFIFFLGLPMILFFLLSELFFNILVLKTYKKYGMDFNFVFVTFGYSNDGTVLVVEKEDIRKWCWFFIIGFTIVTIVFITGIIVFGYLVLNGIFTYG